MVVRISASVFVADGTERRASRLGHVHEVNSCPEAHRVGVKVKVRPDEVLQGFAAGNRVFVADADAPAHDETRNLPSQTGQAALVRVAVTGYARQEVPRFVLAGRSKSLRVRRSSPDRALVAQFSGGGSIARGGRVQRTLDAGVAAVGRSDVVTASFGVRSTSSVEKWSR